MGFIRKSGLTPDADEGSGVSFQEIRIRASEDVYEAAEQGRISQHFASMQEYVSALILDGAGRVSGLTAPGVLDSVSQDSRIGGAITNAISCIQSEKPDEAIEQLRFAQDIILQALIARTSAVEKPIQDRLRIRGGGDDWSKKKQH